MTPGEERLRNPWIASGWHADPTDAIDAATLVKDGEAVKWSEDPEPLEAFTVVVENLPSGYEAMWADQIVEQLGQEEGYFCCQVVPSANSSMSAELLFTSKEAASCVVAKAHGMKVRRVHRIFGKCLLTRSYSTAPRSSSPTPSPASLRASLRTLTTTELFSRPRSRKRRTWNPRAWAVMCLGWQSSHSRAALLLKLLCVHQNAGMRDSLPSFSRE